MKISAIVACAENGGIGYKGNIPWDLPDDLAYFKKTTMGHTLIMGRKTYETIGFPLPGRRMIILTRQPEYSAEGCEVVNTLRGTLSLAAENDESEVFIAGGSEIYFQAIDKVERVYLTRVHAVLQADSFFPELDESEWEQVSEERHSSDEEHNYAFTFEVWDRKQPSQED